MNKPNIILLLLDDLGYGDISCLNPSSKIPTQNIDNIAFGGMRFTDCHSSSALCTPSRYGLLTGRYNWRSRLKCMVLPGQAPPLIEEGRETLASLLKKQGYKTACVGKWHLGLGWKTKNGYTLPETLFSPTYDPALCFDGIDYLAPIENGPADKGFDYFYGMPASLDQPPFVRIENDRVLTPPDRFVGVRNLDRGSAEQQFEVEYGPAAPDFDPARVVPEMDAKVLELIDGFAESEEPFFLYYPTPAVHGPLVPAPEFRGKSVLNEYADFVLQVDDFIGRLESKLREKGIEENTLLIFASDNGCSAVADYPALISKGHNPSYIFRGMKGDIWEGGHRIPFIVRWPGHIPEAAFCDKTVCLTDVFATLAEITGAGYEDCAGEDSTSFLSLLEGGDRPTREAVVHHATDGSFSIRKGDWKLELCPDSGGFHKAQPKEGAPPYQLYHMSGDVTERYNLYGKHPEVERELLLILREQLENGRSTPGKPQKNWPCENWPGLDWLKEI